MRLLITLVFISLLSIGVLAQSAGATIYNGPDGKGPSQDIPPGIYNVNGKTIATEAGLSVKVAAGFIAKFCESQGSGDGAGACEEFAEGVHNLKSMNFTFIKVAPKAAAVVAPTVTAAQPKSPRIGLTVFEAKHWGGRSQSYAPGMYRSIKGEFGRINDNMAQSAIVEKGFRARFCSYEGENLRGSGDCEFHEEGRYNLRFANSISFIEVIDLNAPAFDDEAQPVVLYEEPSQNGKLQGFERAYTSLLRDNSANWGRFIPVRSPSRRDSAPAFVRLSRPRVPSRPIALNMVPERRT